MNIKSLIYFFTIMILKTITLHAWIGQEPAQGFNIAIEYLAWKAQEDQLQYAAKVPGGIPTSLTNPFAFTIDVINQHFSWDSGFRLQIGYSWCPDYNSCVSWTRFRQNSCGAVAADTETSLVAILFSDPDIAGKVTNFCSSASSRWLLDFDTIDIFFSNYRCPWDRIIFESFIGAKIARINQRQHVLYSQFFDGVDPQDALANRCNKFSGAGPYIGAHVGWCVTPHCSFFGSIAGALCAGRNSAILSTSLPVVARFVQITDRMCRLRSMVDMQVGIRGTCTICEQMSVSLYAAFEAQYWPDQWQCVSSLLTSSVGNITQGGSLTLYGATVGLGLLF